MIKPVMQETINKQITRELYSSNLYLAMAAYFHTMNLNGFANWMRVQAQEEMAHGLKFFDYLLARGGKVEVGTIEAPPSSWVTPLAAFEASLEHEQKVTNWIGEIADLSIKEGDHATHIMLQWFITEQVEEEDTVGQIVDRLKLIGDSKAGLFFIDNELKSRVFTPPPAN